MVAVLVILIVAIAAFVLLTYNSLTKEKKRIELAPAKSVKLHSFFSPHVVFFCHYRLLQSGVLLSFGMTIFALIPVQSNYQQQIKGFQTVELLSRYSSNFVRIIMYLFPL